MWGSDEQYADESSHLFSLYLAYADKHDKERTENWIAGADGILVFVRILSSVTCWWSLIFESRVRLASSPQHWRRSWSTATNPYRQTQASTLSPSSRKYLSKLPMGPNFPLKPPLYLLSAHLPLPFGLTHCGS